MKNSLHLFASIVILTLIARTSAVQSVSTPFPGRLSYPASQPLAAGQKYNPPTLDTKDSVYWGWSCSVTGGPAIIFGGNRPFAADGMQHTRVLKNGKYVQIDTLLRAKNPLQGSLMEALAIVERIKDALTKARHLFFEGRSAAVESSVLADSVDPLLTSIADTLSKLAVSLNNKTGLESYALSQSKWAAAKFSTAALQINSFGASVTSQELTALRQVQITIEIGADALGAEPPPRALSMITWDSLTQRFVLFGGDHLDYLMNDVWLFNPFELKWEQRHPVNSPSPRADHYLTPTDSGRIHLKGGYTYGYYHVGPADWVYDIVNNVWIVPSGVSAATPDTRVYRTGSGIPEFMMAGSKPSTAGTDSVLAHLPENSWVNMNPPIRGGNRVWGTVAYDPDRDMIYIYSGGHGGHCGTDVLHYHMSTNRYEMTVAPDFPLGRAANNEGTNGWSFNLRPWMPGHTRDGYRYHPGLKKMLLLSREGDCCGALIDNYAYVYDPSLAKWEGRYNTGLMRAEAHAAHTCYTSLGFVNWVDGFVWLLNDSTMQWKKLVTVGTVPGGPVDYSGIVFDSKRNRLLMIAFSKYGPPFNGFVYSLDLATLVVTKIIPENATAVSKAPFIREIVYLQNEDLFLFSGTDGVSKGHLVYDPVSNRWMSAAIQNPIEGDVSSGMIYDTKRNLLWHINNSYSNKTGLYGDVSVLKLNKSSLSLTVCGNGTSAEEVSQNSQQYLSVRLNHISKTVQISVNNLSNYEKSTLAVYNLKGELIVDLTKRLQICRPGSRTDIQWGLRNMASGVYLVKLSSTGKTITRSIPFMK